jgi:hypothetical protein
MKVLLGIGIAIVAIAVVVVLALGYLGFMPGVSSLFGSNKAKDLGVTFTSADLKSARAKTSVVNTDLSASAAPADSLKFGTPRKVDAVFTQAECNALLNNHPWQYYPLKDVQLKINSDGTAEFSAILLKDRLQGCAEALKISDGDIQVLNEYLAKVPENPAFYVKGTGGIANNQITGMDVVDFKVGNLSFTQQIKDNESSLSSQGETLMRSIVGMNLESLQIVNGSIKFKGTLPDISSSK